MGVVHFEELKLRQKEIEVRALVALSKSKNEVISFKATQKLKIFAYPEEVAKDLDQPTLTDNYKQRPKRNYWGEKE